MLRNEIVRVVASARASGLVQVRTPMDVAACEVLEDRELVLVYAVISRRELLRTLWGPEVERKVRDRAASRLEHGRWAN
jgi:DNA-binding transcriptional regulator LsrR (DeoR family)